MSSIETLQNLFIEKKLTLSTAESCTGGHLAAAITSRPGASNYYLGSVIAYTNDIKVNLLGVSPATIAKGAVSKETVLEMAAGIIKLTNSDYSLAVSGVAGPGGGTQEKPVGTIWCAIGKKEGAAEAWLYRASGTRSQIIEGSVQELIRMILKRLTE